MRVDGQVTGNAATSGADEKDSSIYDFSTYAEGMEGVRLLMQSGFDGADLWLAGKRRRGELFARKAGPQMLMMHGNSVETAKAHGVLVENTNALIEDWLRFR